MSVFNVLCSVCSPTSDDNHWLPIVVQCSKSVYYSDVMLIFSAENAVEMLLSKETIFDGTRREIFRQLFTPSSSGRRNCTSSIMFAP